MSGESKRKLKCEFEKEDSAFLSDTIYVPTGFMELVDDLVYSVLLQQPAGGELSLAKFAKKYFSDLLELITSNAMDEDVSDSISDDNENINSIDRSSMASDAETPLFTVDQVVVPTGLQDIIHGLIHRTLVDQPQETKLDLTQFALDHFEKILASYSDVDLTLTSEDLKLSNENTNRESKGISATDGANQERRFGISSEHFDPDGRADVKKVPKDATTTQRLRKSAAGVMPLRNLDEKELMTVIEALEPRSVKAGALVIREGDDGDDFFIVDSGTFNIFKREKNDAGEKSLGALISTLKGEGSFGELALLYNWPRQASVRAVTDGSLWVLDRADYQSISGNAAFQQRLALQQIIGKVEILKKLNPEEILDVCDAISVKEFGNGSAIIKQNDDATTMFFLMEGEAVVSMKSAAGVSKEIQRLQPGSYFGEMALINMEKRQATVTAVGRVRCGELHVDAFERLLGPCKEVMRRNQQYYRDRAASVFRK